MRHAFDRAPESHTNVRLTLGPARLADLKPDRRGELLPGRWDGPSASTGSSPTGSANSPGASGSFAYELRDLQCTRRRVHCLRRNAIRDYLGEQPY